MYSKRKISKICIDVEKIKKAWREKRRLKPIRIKHSSLRRIDDSLFRRECPKCKEGILPETRIP